MGICFLISFSFPCSLFAIRESNASSDSNSKRIFERKTKLMIYFHVAVFFLLLSCSFSVRASGETHIYADNTMTSTEFNIGLGSGKSSSRVLKPPGGGHSNIFGGAEAKPINPRPKYDQQNSSNLNFCMNTTDPNIKVVEQVRPVAAAPVAKPTPPPEVENGGHSAPSAPSAPPPSAPEPVVQKPTPEPASAPAARQAAPAPEQQQQSGRSRVPPGGFSSGLW